MSDSELFLVKETGEEENMSKSRKFQRVLKLKLANELGRDTVSSSSTSPESCNQQGEDTDREERCGDSSITIESKQKQRGSLFIEDHQVEVEDDDSGFRTPTSTEHRIKPETNQCPPAPRKPKPSLKRKTSQSRFIYDRNPPLDVSEELESLFSSTPQSTDDHPSSQNNFKKARKEDTV